MSVANILKADGKINEIFLPATVGGPFLPLAGGTMDASPAGVINAHTITKIITLEGDSAGTGFDTTIKTNANNDLNLQTTGADGINIDCGQLTIDSQIRTEINGTTVIQPIAGYTYPNNPEAGLIIQNWDNPNPAQTSGLLVKDIDAPASSSFGIRVVDIGNPAGTTNSFGVDIQNVRQTKVAGTVSFGSRLQNVVSGLAYGHYVNNIDADVGAVIFDGSSGSANGDCYGLRINQLLSTAANTKGLVADFIQAPNGISTGCEITNIDSAAIGYGVNVDNVRATVGDANGVSINNIQGNTEARGMFIQNLIANTGTISGVEIDGLTSLGAGQDGRGVSVNNITSDGNCVGVESRVLNSVSQTTTGFSASLLDAAFQVFGARFSGIGTLTGSSEAYGIDMTNIKQAQGTPGTIAMGVNMTSMEADDARGVNIQTVYGNSRANGIQISDVKTTNTALPAYGLVASRGTKLANAAGMLLRLLDGNSGFAVQDLNAPGAGILPDGGNFVIIDAGAGIAVPLIPPGGGAAYDDGAWFLITKDHNGPHQITIPPAIQFNAQAPGAPWAFGGAAFDFILMFHFQGVWYVKQW